MKLNELVVYVQLKEDITEKTMAKELSTLLNTAVCEDSELKLKHQLGGERLFYTFSRFIDRPNGKARVYKKLNVNSFKVRAVDIELLKAISRGLETAENKGLNKRKLKFITSNIQRREINNINALSISTPMQVKENFKSKNNIMPNQLMLFKEKLNTSTITKYNAYTGEDVPHDLEIFTNIRLEKTPTLLQMGNFSKKGVLGALEVNQHPDAIKVALFGVHSGLGASCSYMGSGFVNIVKGVSKHD